MKPAKEGVRGYGAGPLNRTTYRSILVQGPMRSDPVVVIYIESGADVRRPKQ